jgi:hypothetical protein
MRPAGGRAALTRQEVKGPPRKAGERRRPPQEVLGLLQLARAGSRRQAEAARVAWSAAWLGAPHCLRCWKACTRPLLVHVAAVASTRSSTGRPHTPVCTTAALSSSQVSRFDIRQLPTTQGLISTKWHSPTPRDRASMPTAPVPANRSSHLQWQAGGWGRQVRSTLACTRAGSQPGCAVNSTPHTQRAHASSCLRCSCAALHPPRVLWQA